MSRGATCSPHDLMPRGSRFGPCRPCAAACRKWPWWRAACARYYDNVIAGFMHGIKLGLVEAINGKIARLRAAAHGFSDREYFKLKIFQRCSLPHNPSSCDPHPHRFSGGAGFLIGTYASVRRQGIGAPPTTPRGEMLTAGPEKTTDPFSFPLVNVSHYDGDEPLSPEGSCVEPSNAVVARTIPGFFAVEHRQADEADTASARRRGGHYVRVANCIRSQCHSHQPNLRRRRKHQCDLQPRLRGTRQHF